MFIVNGIYRDTVVVPLHTERPLQSNWTVKRHNLRSLTVKSPTVLLVFHIYVRRHWSRDIVVLMTLSKRPGRGFISESSRQVSFRQCVLARCADAFRQEQHGSEKVAADLVSLFYLR